MKRRVLSAFLCTVLAASMLAGCGSKPGSDSESDMEYVKDKGSLIVGITNFEPMDYRMKMVNGSVLTRIWQEHLQKVLA